MASRVDSIAIIAVNPWNFDIERTGSPLRYVLLVAQKVMKLGAENFQRLSKYRGKTGGMRRIKILVMQNIRCTLRV
jgi:hypothetical protein